MAANPLHGNSLFAYMLAISLNDLKVKRVLFHEMYRVEVFGLKYSNYISKKKYNFCEYVKFGAIFLEKSTFCQ